MAAPKFDSNTWYQLWVGDGKQSFLSTVAYADSGTKGAVFFNWTDTSSKTQQWQIFQLNSTSWVLRTAEAGPSVYMAAALSNDEITEGKTRPMMARGDIADASAFWTFDSWGDGTYIITNAANGTGYHLNRKDNALMAMSPNISAPQNGQRWQYKSISNIDDKKYSTIDVRTLSYPALDTTYEHANTYAVERSNNSHREHIVRNRNRIHGIRVLPLHSPTIFEFRRDHRFVLRRSFRGRQSRYWRSDRRYRAHRVDCIRPLLVEKKEAKTRTVYTKA